jgi:hypothetical protein
LLTVEQDFQLGPPPREAAQHLLDRHFRAVLLAQAEFLVNEVGGRFRVPPEFGVACQVVFRQGALSLAPLPDHVTDQFRRQRFCRLPAQRARLRLVRRRSGHEEDSLGK